MAENLEEQLRLSKIAQIKGLVNQLFLIDKDNEFKDFKLAGDKSVEYYDAMIEILNTQVLKNKIIEPKMIRFDHIEQERSKMSKEDIEEYEKKVALQSQIVDTYLATIERRCSLKGNIETKDSIILRYRGNAVGDDFSKKYPLGVLM